jgi:hypothetical protein
VSVDPEALDVFGHLDVGIADINASGQFPHLPDC